MPIRPKGQDCPANVIGNAVNIMRIATGEEEDTIIDDGKAPAARALGAKGGKKRSENMRRPKGPLTLTSPLTEVDPLQHFSMHSTAFDTGA